MAVGLTVPLVVEFFEMQKPALALAAYNLQLVKSNFFGIFFLRLSVMWRASVTII